MPAPAELLDLIERFRRNLDSYHRGDYNETQLRVDYLDPFFELLGWDMHNRKGYAEAYRDVIHEAKQKVGGATKAPDYLFRIGPERKFFLEAKKPAVKINVDHEPAFQLRRYAWSAKLPLSVLSDFEEFAVYDCRVKPHRLDRPSVARVMYFTFDQIPERWDEFAGIFSKNAILHGSFDSYAESAKKKKGTGEVDDAFLQEIEDWRDMLAKNLALRNPDLSQDELNFAVQRTIDRIIFLRICEDRGIEEYGRLQSLQNGSSVYPRLVQLFHQADSRYNSGLFHFSNEKGQIEGPDELTPELVIDDKPLKEIFRRLYYPESPYEFSVLPGSILGHIYERFLGKVITLTKGHRAKVEEKPEVRKAGGVYYTPDYVSEYIVENTVGKLVEGKDPKAVAKLRVLDPACGSGSFLLAAYDFLLNWHLEWYSRNDPKDWAKKRNPPIYRTTVQAPMIGASGEAVEQEGWRLTTTAKREILLNNIYGVDIDRQAVEVTKLSLLLRVLEGESEETLGAQLALLRERVLPDLAENIRCGNSLVGSDVYASDNADGADLGVRRRLNAFDWSIEFGETMKRGGFDAVIGNPPYGGALSDTELSYVRSRYRQASRFPDTYCCFMVRAYELCREGGFVSFIVPNTFCDLENCVDFRRWFLDSGTLERIWQTGWAFDSAIVDTLVFIVTKRPPADEFRVRIDAGSEYAIQQSRFRSNALSKIDYRNRDEAKAILEIAQRTCVPLGEIADIRAGVKMYEKGKGNPPQTASTLDERPYSDAEQHDGWRPLYRGTDITRYRLLPPSEYVCYGEWLAAPRAPQLFESPKILMRRTDDKLKACLESDSAICVNSCHVIKLKTGGVHSGIRYEYLLGLLNSRLLQRVFEIQNPQMVGKVFAEIKVVYVARLPIRQIDVSNCDDVRAHDELVGLVRQIVALNDRRDACRTDSERTFLERQLAQTDRQIDKLVYRLYNLTADEIEFVEVL